MDKIEISNLIDDDFLKEMSDDQIDWLKQAIFTHFYGKHIVTTRGEIIYICTLSKLQDAFGLPYNSGSSMAAVWQTNSEYEYAPGFWIRGFAIHKGFPGQFVIMTKDVEENWKYFSLIQ